MARASDGIRDGRQRRRGKTDVWEASYCVLVSINEEDDDDDDSDEEEDDGDEYYQVVVDDDDNDNYCGYVCFSRLFQVSDYSKECRAVDFWTRHLQANKVGMLSSSSLHSTPFIVIVIIMINIIIMIIYHQHHHHHLYYQISSSLSSKIIIYIIFVIIIISIIIIITIISFRQDVNKATATRPAMDDLNMKLIR